MKEFPQFVVAAPASGGGKTTVCRGLMGQLAARGMRVGPFKCGPDYIDTMFHRGVCGRASVNLDLFLAGERHVRELYGKYSASADVCIVEGMMGLYDGFDRYRGSTGDVARTLGLPVVLVVDARSSAYSSAALLSGFAGFMGGVSLAGVIYNNVGSAKHASMLRRACSDAGQECLGCVPRSPEAALPSRYLGLDFSHGGGAEGLAKLIEENVDWRRLLELTTRPEPKCFNEEAQAKPGESLVTAVARSEESFSFVYQEHIDALRSLGHVVFFNPEDNAPLPPDVGLLYLPGGYPEKHLPKLSAAGETLRSIKSYVERGGKVIAECGGMMYLCRSIITNEGATPLCGVLPYDIDARNEARRLSLGYRKMEINGVELRGHEFHYTRFADPQPPSDVEVFDAKGDKVCSPMFVSSNIIAGYTHLYWPRNPMRLFSGEAERAETKTISPTKERRALRPVMLAGTGSDVGKSVLAAAFCRIFRQDGYHPAPFKAQNMALNSFATPDGREIGRAQAVQAEAAGVECETDMNPVLLKPSGEGASQVVLHGRPAGVVGAYDYFRREGRERLRSEVCAAFDRLARRYNPIVLEGAGSISELNLRDTDIVNLPMAAHAGAAVILVGDIDRGGVFASLYGSIALQRPSDRAMIKGIIINKFRGDLRLFADGAKTIERLCGVPVLGVVPYYNNICIDAEDSVSLAAKARHAESGRLNAAVVLLRHISNFTDFDALERDGRMHVFYTNNTDEIAKADIVILPGTKATIADMAELRSNGAARAIVEARRRGATVLGICGGYQMMGREISDPLGAEGDITSIPGLGLLPVETVIAKEKTTRQSTFRLAVPGGDEAEMRGYEIHQGETKPTAGSPEKPLVRLAGGEGDGYFADGKCMGTYMHGILDNASFVDFLLRPLAPQLAQRAAMADAEAYKQAQYDKLAAHVRKYVDMEKVYEILLN